MPWSTRLEELSEELQRLERHVSEDAEVSVRTYEDRTTVTVVYEHDDTRGDEHDDA